MNENILIIEDDKEIGGLLKSYLSDEGYAIDLATDGEQGCKMFFNATYDLAIIDLMLPKLGGMDVIKTIRENNSVPIIIISAKDSDVDKSLGLGFGADDYITKPFSVIEVLARVKAAIRRATQYAVPSDNHTTTILTFKDIVMSLDDYTVKKGTQDLTLTAKEFEILKLMMTYPKRVFTKAQIYSSVWKDEYYEDENVLNVHMSRLRGKLGDTKKESTYIRTLWGIGYGLEGK